MPEETARLEARLFTAEGPVVRVPDVPAPPPASGGRVTFAIPYPAGEPPRTVTRAVVYHPASGLLLEGFIDPSPVEAGDTLTVTFDAESAGGHHAASRLFWREEKPRIPDGYDFAARVTTRFDGGSHPLKGDLWKCGRCGSAVVPGSYDGHDRDHAMTDAVRANLASLNELFTEMTAKVSDDPDFTTLVRELLRKHSHALGFEFMGDGGGEPL